MRVCLLNDSFPPVIDGVANVVMNYAKILQEDKLADVIVGTPEYPGTDYSVYPYTVIPYSSIDTTRIVKGYRAGNPLDLIEAEDMAKFGPEIIHSHCPVSSTVMARILRAKTEAPIVFTYHTKFDVDIAKAVKAKFIQKETIKSLVNNIEACDEVWVVSEGAGENLKSLGYTGDYRVMHNGVDFEKGRVSQEEVRKAVKGYDLPEGIPVFLFVGRIINYKGIPLILEAMKILEERGMDFRMVFIGSGPDEGTLKQQAREYGLCAEDNTAGHSKCIFTGPIYDRNVLRAWNTRADLFLFPSTYDTNGIVVREAAACGLASVLIQGSCAAEGITDAQNGYLIEENSKSMADLLFEVCKDMEHVQKVGENAMNQIYISWRDSVHEAFERYEEILELKKQGCFVRKPYVAQQTEEVWRRFLAETEQLRTTNRKVFEQWSEDVEDTMERLRNAQLRERFDEEIEGFKDRYIEFLKNL